MVFLISEPFEHMKTKQILDNKLNYTKQIHILHSDKEYID